MTYQPRRETPFFSADDGDVSAVQTDGNVVRQFSRSAETQHNPNLNSKIQLSTQIYDNILGTSQCPTGVETLHRGRCDPQRHSPLQDCA